MKDEFKQAEGDPAIKGKMRQVRQMRRPMMAPVPKDGRYYQPGVLDALALKIREVAGNIRSDRRKARASRGFSACNRSAVSAEHYKAVAEVIGDVMRLRRGIPLRR